MEAQGTQAISGCADHPHSGWRSYLTVSAWGAFGWSVKQNGVPLKRTSSIKPLIVSAAVVMIAAIGGALLGPYILEAS